MPGMNFVFGKTGGLEARKSILWRALQATVHLDHHENVVIEETPDYVLACTKYPTYPVSHFDTNAFSIYLEGCVRGVSSSQIEGVLVDLGRLVFQDTPETRAQVATWLLETDGEFNVLFLEKSTKNVAILTDALSHLPLYYGSTPDLFVVSRDPGFILSFVTTEVDRQGLAEFLLFRYSLDARTPFRGVRRVPPATVLRGGYDKTGFDVSSCHILNFDHREHSGLSAAQNARNLADLIVSGCRTSTSWMSSPVNIMSLSGGLDSRVVVAAMQRAGVAFHAATLWDHRPRTAEDVRVAKRLANHLGLQWKLFELPRPTFADAERLLRLRCGLNYLGMTFILAFFRMLRDHYGRDLVYWTGDTGLAIRGELPSTAFRGYDELLDYILRRHGIIPLRVVAAVLGMPVADIREQVIEVLKAYPETSLRQKYVHFVTHGRQIKWQYEGMDRNRAFFWTVAPLEFTRVVLYAMQCPDEQKSEHRQYRALLRLLSPAAGAIEYAHVGVAPLAPWFPAVMWAREFTLDIRLAIRRRLRRRVGRDVETMRAGDNVRECVVDQLQSSPVLGEVLVRDEAERFAKHCTPQQANALLTATSSIELAAGEDSSLKRRQQLEFDG